MEEYFQKALLMPTFTPSDSDLKSTAWWQWLDRCQLIRCDDHCREYLEAVLISRFRKHMRSASLGMGFDIFAQKSDKVSPTSSNADLPYLFENWLKFIKKEVNRKCVKSYIQLKSNGDAGNIEAQMTLLLRDYVRDLWRREGTEQMGGSSADSLNRTINDGFDSTVADFVSGNDPAPGQEAELAELDDICLGCAKTLYSEMSFDERLLLSGRAVGRGPSHPEILAEASVGKSVLYEKEKGIELKLDAYLRKNFCNDLKHEPRMLVLLAKYTWKHLLSIGQCDFFRKRLELSSLTTREQN